eukprot:g52299.t1
MWEIVTAILVFANPTWSFSTISTNIFTCQSGCNISLSRVEDNWCDCELCEDESRWNCDTCYDCPTTCTSAPSYCVRPFNISLYSCKDGCQINSFYLDDGWCDCSDCEDESRLTCKDCWNGCPTICGAYSHCAPQRNFTMVIPSMFCTIFLLNLLSLAIRRLETRHLETRRSQSVEPGSDISGLETQVEPKQAPLQLGIQSSASSESTPQTEAPSSSERLQMLKENWRNFHWLVTGGLLIPAVYFAASVPFFLLLQINTGKRMLSLAKLSLLPFARRRPSILQMNTGKGDPAFLHPVRMLLWLPFWMILSALHLAGFILNSTFGIFLLKGYIQFDLLMFLPNLTDFSSFEDRNPDESKLIMPPAACITTTATTSTTTTSEISPPTSARNGVTGLGGMANDGLWNFFYLVSGGCLVATVYALAHYVFIMAGQPSTAWRLLVLTRISLKPFAAKWEGFNNMGQDDPISLFFLRWLLWLPFWVLLFSASLLGLVCNCLLGIFLPFFLDKAHVNYALLRLLPLPFQLGPSPFRGSGRPSPDSQANSDPPLEGGGNSLRTPFLFISSHDSQ